MLTSISFLQSASASALASSQQLWMGPKLLTAASSSTQWVSPSSPSPSLVVQAKAKTRREDRTARHIRIRKKVPALFFSSSDSLRLEPQLLKFEFNFIALEVKISICLSNAYVMFAKLPQ